MMCASMPLPLTALKLRSRALSLLAGVAATAGCGGGAPPQESATAVMARGPHRDVELPQLEIHADGVDRFSTCPPSGGVTRGWIPTIPEWTPPKAAPAPAPSATAGGIAEREIAILPRPDDPPNAPTPTEKALRDTLAPFRSCQQRGILHQGGSLRDHSQDGHVAIIVRVGPDGRVVRSESYGACHLSREVVSCMMDVGKRLRFEAPAQGSSTIILPAVFAPRSGIAREAPGPNDDYTAAATVALEAARPGLHECEARERRAVRPPEAWGTYSFPVDEQGHAGPQEVTPFDGNQELLKCAGEVLQRTPFPPGPAIVRVRVSFNPRGVAIRE